MRQLRGLTQRQLAEALHVTDSYVSLMESGSRKPRQRLIDKVAETLGCSPDFLLTGRRPEEIVPLHVDLRFAELALRAGDAAAARDRFTATLSSAQGLGTGYRGEALEARWGLSRALEATGDIERAIAELERLLAESQLPPTVSRKAVAMTLCRSCLQCGDITRAIEVGERAIRQLPDGFVGDEAIELGSTLVLCYYERGDLTTGKLLADRLIAAAESGGSARARGAAYWNAAIVAEARGELRAAMNLAERALALYGEVDNARALALLRLTTAWVMLRQSEPRPAEAAALLEGAHAVFLEVGNPVDLASTETELARCALLRGDPVSAAGLATTAIERLAGAPRLESARARAVLADAQHGLGDIDAALVTYARAAADLERADASRQAAELWRELADRLAALDRRDEALAAYRRATEVLGIRTRTTSTWSGPGRAEHQLP